MHIRMLPVLATAVLALPAGAAAQSTGGASAPAARPAGAVALTAGPHALLGHAAKLTGTVKPRHRGRVVLIQRYDEVARSWISEAATTVARDGVFAARWRPRALGELRLRATLEPRRSASATSASPEVSVRVFEPALATWYGPRLYGNLTACGQELTRELVGVAHRTLPCGTLVEIAHGGSSLVVPVVDRGPFVDGIAWDLTKAAADALGLTATTRVGALVQSR